MTRNNEHTLIWRKLAAVFAAFVLSLGSVAYAANDSSKHFEIKAKPLADALMEFGVQSGLTVVAPTTLTAGKEATAVRGDLAPTDALGRLLNGSGLTFARAADGTIAIQAITSTGLVQASAGESGLDKDLTEGPKLTEIIVTAQKREERLQDVPVPVSVLNGTSLAETNEVRIQDYALTVPGLSVSGQNGFYQNLSIRGITTGTANPTVGIMVDDVPFGSSSIDGGGLFVPDFDPGDLARVEVLRGPQGTLYGASSMGGLLKFVTIDPSVSELSGRVSAGTSSVYNGDQLGYNVRGSVNVPLTDTVAVRMSAFTREDPGYIDDPVLHRDGVNKTTADGGRVAALWRPSDEFSLKLAALYQDVQRGGDNNVAVGAGLGTYDQVEVPGGGASDTKVQVYSATATGKVGLANLTAISGYTVNQSQFSQDYSYYFGGSTGITQFGVTGAREDLNMRNAKFTQEIRLAMPLGNVADWLVGGFYSHERTSYGQALNAENSTTGQIVGQWVYFSVPQTYSEYAGFTDITFHVTDTFDVQLGARDSHIDQSSSEAQFGAPYAALYGLPNPVIYPSIDSNANAFTYLVTPQWKITPDWMAYARLASGYRPGGPNVAPGTPAQYAPDKTQNYELGVKGDALGHRITVDGSLYYIDWKNIQLTLTDPQNDQGYTANASRAKSQGIELSVSATPLAGLTTAAWVVWNTAVLKQGFPYSNLPYEAYGAAGDRLPFGSRFSGNVTVTDEFALTSRITASVAVVESYVGNQLGGFQYTITPGIIPARQYYAPYARTDLRAVVKFDTWSANLFANNVTNRFAAVPLGGLDGSPLPPNYYSVLQPRLVGINLTKSF